MRPGRSLRLFDDTSPAAEAKLVELLRKKAPAEKLAMVNQLNASVKSIAISGLRLRFPDKDEVGLHQEFARLLLGPELAGRVEEEFLRSRSANDE